MLHAKAGPLARAGVPGRESTSARPHFPLKKWSRTSRYSFIMCKSKANKMFGWKGGKKILVLTIPWWAPSSLHRLRLRAGLPTSRLTSHAKLFPAPYHRPRFLFPFFFLLQPSQMFNGYAIVSCILLFWYSPLHMSLFNYVHKLWFNYSLCIFVLAYICYVLNFSYTL